VFLYASKLVWAILQPSNALCVLCLAGFACFFLKKAGLGCAFLATSAAFYLLAGFPLFSTTPMLALEQRYNRPADADVSPTGIIVLGGAIDPALTAARGAAALTDSGERLTEGVRLSRVYPKARLVFSGGSWLPSSIDNGEAAAARKFFIDLGVSPERITLEDRSRNTYENAVFSTAALDPKPGEQWLLVTSAYHMPRAMGCFRAAGFAVTPWPVDYRARGWRDLLWIYAQPSEGLRNLDLSLKEWMGLAAYRLSGRTDRWLP
jgi:uncharacterized SAM-binding protein YcdF (DUF218 family)